MKIKEITAMALLIPTLMISSLTLEAQETAAIRLENGIALMKNETQLDDAIREFQAILTTEEGSLKLAAEARYHIVDCYLKLDNKEEALKHMQTLREKYATENPWVIKGEALFPSGPEFAPITWADSEFAIYDVKLPNGNVVGEYYSIIKASRENGEKTWTGYFTRTAGGLSQSSVEFRNQDLSLIRSHGYMEGMGEFEGEFSNSPSWQIKDVTSDEITANGEIKLGGKLFDNDQSIHLLRLLPNQVGDVTSLPIVVVFMGGSKLDLELEAVSHEKVKTNLGEFDCVKYKSNIHQDFWVQRDGPRYLVKMKLPGAYLELKEVRKDWSEETPVNLKSNKGHGKIKAPKGTFELPITDNKKVFRCRLTDSKLRFRVATIELQDSANFSKSLRGENKATLSLLFKNMGNEKTKIEVYEKNWREWSRQDQIKASVGFCKVTQGELVNERLILCAHGKKKSLTMTFDYRLGASEEIAQLAQEMFKNWVE